MTPTRENVIFIQPFSLFGNGGGARILRSALEAAPCDAEALDVCMRSNPAAGNREGHLPSRMALGRIDHSRFAFLGTWVEEFSRLRFRARLKDRLQRSGATAIHIVPHSGGDFYEAWKAARDLGLRVVMSMHDDLEATAASHRFLPRLLERLGEVWRNADHRFVICPEMGRMCCDRYGERPFETHTDGVEAFDVPSFRLPAPSAWRIFFMGLFMVDSAEVFVSFARALDKLKTHLGVPIDSFTLRGAVPPAGVSLPADLARWLPVANDAQIRRDLTEYHVGYLPLVMKGEHREATRYALSTKMISYLAAGLPIIFQGPPESAAAGFLRRHDIAILLDHCDPDAIASTLADWFRQPERLADMARRGWECARNEFRPEIVQTRFWSGMLGRNATPKLVPR